MAGTTELLKRLDSDGEPLAKRLCLAQNVFESMQLPLPRKEETVTNWLCQVAGKFKEKGKRKSLVNPSEDFVKLWSTLRSCLANPRLDVADIRPSTRAGIIEALSKQLKRKDLSHNDALLVLECSISVFKARSFQTYFSSNSSLCVEFANNLLKFMSVECTEHTSLIRSSLAAFQTIAEHTKSKNDLRLMFLDEMLFTLADLLKCDKIQSTLISKDISRCVKQVLFPTTSSDFFEFLAANISNLPCSESQHLVPKKLLTILEKARNSLEEDTYITLLTMIFASCAMVVQYQKDAKDPDSHLFSMFVFISYIAGFETTNQKSTVSYGSLKKICAKGELTTMSLKILCNMIQLLAQKGMGTAEINGTSFTDWLSVLLESLFTSPSSFDPVSFLKLMSSLLQLYPLMVKNILKNIFSVIMTKPLSQELQSTYTTFLSEVLTLSNKLSRIPTFITVFVSSLKEGFKKQQECGISPTSYNMWLPLSFIQQLVEVATVMPSQSSITVLNFLIKESETYIEPNENSSEAELKNSYRNLLIQTVYELISAIFRGVRMLELSTTDIARKRFCLVMKNLSNQLSSFGKFVLKDDENNDQAISSFLNVAHHWAAEAILIEQYADAGREELLESVGTNLRIQCEGLCGGSILSYLHPYLSSSEWESIYDKVLNLGGKEWMSLLLKLDFQLLSALIMFNSSESSLPKVVAKRACALMVQRFSNESALLIDQNLASNVILMAPLLDASELSSLGDCLTASLIANQSDGSLKDVMTLLTEERLIACGLVCSVLNSLRLKVKSSKRKKDESGVKLWKNAKAVLSKLDAEVVIQQELKGHAMSEELRSVLLSMACPLSEALSSLDGCQRQLSGEESDLTNLSQHLHVLRSFPLGYFTSGCQDVVFLSLLSIALDCSPLAPSQMKDDILGEIFDHLLLGLYEKGKYRIPNLKGYLDHAPLIGALAYFVVHHNVGSRLLELLLGQALRQEQSQQQILERIMVVKSEGKKQTPSKENMLLGTLFLQVAAEMKFKSICSEKSSSNLDESTSNPQNKLRKACKKIAKTFENLIQHQLVNTEEGMHAFTLSLKFNLMLEKDNDKLLLEFERFCHSAVSSLHSSQKADIKTAESFILTVCHYRQNLSSVFPEFFIKDVWTYLTVSSQPNELILKAIIEAATVDETSYIINDLLSKTKLENVCLSNIVLIWSMLLRMNSLTKSLTTVHSKSPDALKDMFRLQQLGKVSLQQLLGFLNDILLSQKMTRLV